MRNPPRPRASCRLGDSGVCSIKEKAAGKIFCASDSPDIEPWKKKIQLKKTCLYAILINFNFEKVGINLNVYCTHAFKLRNPLLCFGNADVTIFIVVHCPSQILFLCFFNNFINNSTNSTTCLLTTF